MNVKYRLSGTELIYLKQYIIRESTGSVRHVTKPPRPPGSECTRRA